MMNLTVLAVGTVKEDFLRAGIGEYLKRLSAFATVSVTEIKEERIADEDNHAAVRAALCAEGEKLLNAAPKGAYKIALCVEGQSPDSQGLAALIGRAADTNGKIALFIGSSHGLSDEVKQAADYRLSVSALTYPHQLMRLMILESLYRSLTILAGKHYHK